MNREDWDRKYAGRELLWTEAPSRFLVSEVADVPPGTALDLACGEGRNAVWLAERGWAVTGVDFSEVAIRKARRLAAQHGVAPDFVVADLLSWEPEGGRYDLIVVFYLQLPQIERRAVLRKAAAALAPGGTLLVVAHHLANLTEGWGGPSSSEVLCTEGDIVADIPELTVARAERVTRPVPGAPGAREAIDLLVRVYSSPGLAIR
jgi:SAM-dependent methyltransferase